MDRFVLNVLGFLISVKFAIKIDVLLQLIFILSKNVLCFMVMESAAPSEDTPKTAITNFRTPSLNLKTMYTITVYEPKPIIKKINNVMYTCILQDS